MKTYLKKVVFGVAALVLLLTLVAPGISASDIDGTSASSASIAPIFTTSSPIEASYPVASSDLSSSYTAPTIYEEPQPDGTILEPEEPMLPESIMLSENETGEVEATMEIIQPDMSEEDVNPDTLQTTEPKKGQGKGKGYSNNLFRKSN